MLGIVCGLKSEAKLLRGINAKILVSSPRRSKNDRKAAIEKFAGEGISLLISFGTAGALDPSFDAGNLVLATEVMEEGGKSWPTDHEFLVQLNNSLPGAVLGGVLSRDRPVLTAAEKEKLHHQSGAVAVDMESHLVAKIAEDSGKPFLVLRAIVDTALTTIPSVLFEAIDEDGNARARFVFQALLKGNVRPTALSILYRAVKKANAALLGSAAALDRLSK